MRLAAPTAGRPTVAPGHRTADRLAMSSTPAHPSEADGVPSRPADTPLSWFGGPATTEHSSWTDTRLGMPEAEANGATSTAPLAVGTQDSEGQAPPFFRIYRLFLLARALLAFMLLALMGGATAIGNAPPLWMLLGAAAYMLLTIGLWLWPSQRREPADGRQRLSSRQALGSVGVDLICFALVQYLTGQAVNTQALLVLPVLMAAVLMPSLFGFGVAATATINLLASALLQGGSDSALTHALTQAGLTGFGLFAIAALASELSTRLAKEERSARGSMELARQQAQLNKLVIEEMGEGVMVVDRKGRVRTANPAARKLLSVQGLAPPAPFQLRGVPAWRGLIKAVELAVGNPQRADQGQDTQLIFDDQLTRDLRVRVRFTRSPESRAPEDMCVLLIEDLRTVRARQRQDKLAAMGRMSAGIAHEIRNPLAAIAQANALMSEDAQTTTQTRLTQMITDNVARLKLIIDDILTVAPGTRPHPPLIDPLETVVSICNDWRSTQGLRAGEDSLLDIDLSGCPRLPGRPPTKVRFEPDHLQRILVNLLDNAFRYSSGEPGAMLVTLRSIGGADGQGMLMLSVCNDGEPVAPDIERSLFEPFFSTRSRGTGLGLYICRELCERHGATIDYRLHPIAVRHRNEFFLAIPIEPAGSAPIAA
jgi:two-component system, NtrC family, sensor histidine kinase PilS